MTSLVVSDLMKEFSYGGIPLLRKKKTVRALDGVSFECLKNRVTCILGPNGAGKTTLLKILAGLIIPDRGEITGLSGRVGLMTPNDRSFYWRLSGLQNLHFFAALNNLKGRERQTKITTLVEEFGLTADIKKPYRLYSTGMKYKLLLARALLGNPELLLLDEPTSHIDPLAREQIHSFIRESLLQKRGITVILCTHDLSEAKQLSDRLVLLNKGKIIIQGTYLELAKRINPHVMYQIGFKKKCPIDTYRGLDLIDITEKDDSYEFTLRSQEPVPQLIAESVRHGAEILWCREREEDLLDIIKRFTGEEVTA